MGLLLHVHPHSRTSAVDQIEAEIRTTRGVGLLITYTMRCKMPEIALPSAQMPSRGSDLWLHTCFEAFLRPSNGTSYYELNVAPSAQWAAYRFSGYRTDMSETSEMSVLQVTQSRSDVFRLQISLQLDPLSDLARANSWHVGLSAVIEETSGNVSHWALAHHSGKPDFHHPDSLVHELSASEQT